METLDREAAKNYRRLGLKTGVYCSRFFEVNLNFE